jgi:BarA-like signal transduction histidine kinase
MMTSVNPVISPANLCALAKMVSNAGLQRMMFAENFKPFSRQMKSLLKKTGVELEPKSTFSEMIEVCYDHLLKNYRHEYLYKVALLNSYVLSHYSLADTILLNEFKIGNSKADTVLVNGTNKVFEIKTELDSPERLTTQLNDYFKAFSEVYIVIHHSAIDKYRTLVDPHVGIMVFGADHAIQTLRSAIPYHEKLETPAMLKAVRKEEYLHIVKTLCGTVPAATPVHLFKACLNALSGFPVLDVQAEFLKTIKQRINPLTNELIQDTAIPTALRFSCYNYNLDRNDYLSLIQRLNYQL